MNHKLVTLSSQIPGIYAALTAWNAPEKIEVPTVWWKEQPELIENRSLLGSMIFELRNFTTFLDDDPIISMQFYCRDHYLRMEDKS